MDYVSSRDEKRDVFSFEQVLMEGLARDGGLYLPNKLVGPKDKASLLKNMKYAELASELMYPYVRPSISKKCLQDLTIKSYANFADEKTAPLIEIAQDIWIMELFHGPTLAFKDFALQLVGRLFSNILQKHNIHITILGATSGDTGSAAIEAFRGHKNISIFILYPDGRISDVQRKQMTSVTEKNVHSIAIEGSFDDCQHLVKELFNDLKFRDEMQLGAINSINWGRILAQTVYYWYAALKFPLEKKGVSFSVPTGNFGNVFAGWVAANCGLPIDNLIVATNENDILARFFNSGIYKKDSVIPSISPSMDIQVASNFERLLYYMLDLEASQVKNMMHRLGEINEFSVDESKRSKCADMFIGKSISDEVTLKTIKKVYSESGILIDPHTATGVAAANHLCGYEDKKRPVVCLATAHPAKFPEAVKKATGIWPDLPERISDLMERKENIIRLTTSAKDLKAYLRKNSNTK